MPDNHASKKEDFFHGRFSGGFRGDAGAGGGGWIQVVEGVQPVPDEGPEGGLIPDRSPRFLGMAAGGADRQGVGRWVWRGSEGWFLG